MNELHYYDADECPDGVRRYAVRRPFSVDGVQYDFRLEQVHIRLIIDLFDDHRCHSDCGATVGLQFSYTPWPYRDGPICGRCWLLFKYVHGEKSRHLDDKR